MSVSCFCWVAIEPGWCGVGRSSGPSACPCPGAYLPPCHHALHAISLASPVPGRPGRRVPVPYLSANSPANPDHHRHLRYRLSVPGRVSSCHVLSPRAESRIIPSCILPLLLTDAQSRSTFDILLHSYWTTDNEGPEACPAQRQGPSTPASESALPGLKAAVQSPCTVVCSFPLFGRRLQMHARTARQASLEPEDVRRPVDLPCTSPLSRYVSILHACVPELHPTLHYNHWR